MNTDCFGYKDGKCTALIQVLCETGECPFYKTEEQFIKDAEKAEKNLKRKWENC